MIQNYLTQKYFCPRIRLACTNNSTCFSALLASPVFTLPLILLSTQKTWGICKQLFCILCLCSKHQITEIKYQSISFHELWGKIVYGGFKPNIIECQAGEMWWTVYFNSQAPVTSVRVCFILQMSLAHQAEHSLPVTGSAAAGKRAPKSFPS